VGMDMIGTVIVDGRVTVCIVEALDGIMSALVGSMSVYGVGVVKGAESSGLGMRHDDGVLSALLVMRRGCKGGSRVCSCWVGSGATVMIVGGGRRDL
jgi:hypothetical protein